MLKPNKILFTFLLLAFILFLFCPNLALAAETTYLVRFPDGNTASLRFTDGRWLILIPIDNNWHTVSSINPSYDWQGRLNNTDLAPFINQLKPRATDEEFGRRLIEAQSSMLRREQPAAEAEAAKPVLRVAIGGSILEFKPVSCQPGEECEIGWIGEYVAVLYKYGVGLAAVLAVVMIMVGGFLWLTSAGSPDKVGKAKEFIVGALSGLFLALFSFIILYTINPRLVALEPLSVFAPEEVELGEASPERARSAVAARTGEGGGGSDIGLFAPEHQDAVNEIAQQGRQSQRPTTYPGHDNDTNSAEYATDVWPDSQASGDELATYVIENAEELGVSYIIWNQRIWNPNPHGQGSRVNKPSSPNGDQIKPPSEWDIMEDRGDDTQNHIDHIHISFNS